MDDEFPERKEEDWGDNWDEPQQPARVHGDMLEPLPLDDRSQFNEYYRMLAHDYTRDRNWLDAFGADEVQAHMRKEQDALAVQRLGHGVEEEGNLLLRAQAQEFARYSLLATKRKSDQIEQLVSELSQLYGPLSELRSVSHLMSSILTPAQRLLDTYYVGEISDEQRRMVQEAVGLLTDGIRDYLPPVHSLEVDRVWDAVETLVDTVGISVVDRMPEHVTEPTAFLETNYDLVMDARDDAAIAHRMQEEERLIETELPRISLQLSTLVRQTKEAVDRLVAQLRARIESDPTPSMDTYWLLVPFTKDLTEHALFAYRDRTTAARTPRNVEIQATTVELRALYSNLETRTRTLLAPVANLSKESLTPEDVTVLARISNELEPYRLDLVAVDRVRALAGLSSATSSLSLLQPFTLRP